MRLLMDDCFQGYRGAFNEVASAANMRLRR
jgi:hypothetical protein